MKKLFALILVAVLAVSLVACGGGDGLHGTYTVDHVEMDGQSLTLSELEAMGDDSLSSAKIVIKAGGKASISDETGSVTLDWERTGNGIRIGDQECKIVDGFICLERDGAAVYFRKASN